MDYKNCFMENGGSSNLRFFLASENKELHKKH
ncbi:hypothetical protein CLU81_2928 [Flavobacterium sp. 9]|nr:hypothetical protein CLU81_2928 [Flavobacterium sp. 9]